MGVLIAFNQDFGQFDTVHPHQLFCQTVIGRTRKLDGTVTIIEHTLCDQVFAYLFILQQFLENVLHVIHLCPFFKYTAETAILYVNVHLVEYVAVERMSAVHGSHALYLNTWTVEQYGSQPSCFAGDVDLRALRPPVVSRGGT